MVEFQTLGTLQIRMDGRPITGLAVKERALLTYVLVNSPRRFSRVELADLFWPNVPIEKSRRSLNQALYSIRRSIPSVLQVSSEEIYANGSDVNVDAVNLMNALSRNDTHAILHHLKGSFLTTLGVPDAEDFEEWKSAYSARLLRLIDSHLCNCLRTDAKQITPFLDRITQHLSYLPNTADLIPSITIESSSGQTTSGVSPASTHQVLPLVGRSLQLKQLSSAYTDCEQRMARPVLVMGAAGHGKTRLVEDFVDSINPANDVRILRVRCYESEQKIGYAPIVDILNRSIDPAELNEIDDVWLGALGQLIPFADSCNRSFPTLGPSAAKTRLFESVLRLLCHLSSKRTVVLFIDDLQWADSSSLSLLGYMSRRLGHARLLIICTARTEKTRQQIENMSKDWVKIATHELSAADVTNILSTLSLDLGNPSHIATKIITWTGGNPYLIDQIVQAIIQNGTRTLTAKSCLLSADRLIGGTITQLPRGQQRALASLAIIGRPASIDLLKEVSRIPNFESCADVLIAKGLASAINDRLSTKHDLIREAAYNRIAVFSKTALHRRAAEALERAGGRPSEVAVHYFKSRQKKRAHHFAVKALMEAKERNATEEAIFFLRLMLRTADQYDIAAHFELAELLLRARKLNKCVKAAQLIKEHTTDQDWVAQAELIKTDAEYELGSCHTTAVFERVTALKQHLRLPRHIVQALRLQIRAAYHDGDFPHMQRSIAEMKTFAEEVRTPETKEALANAARVHSLISSSTEAYTWVSDLSKDDDKNLNAEQRIRIKNLLGGILYDLGRLQESESVYRGTISEIERCGAVLMWPITANHLHMLLVEQGRYDEARRLASEIRSRVIGLDAVEESLATLAANEALMWFEMNEFRTAAMVIAEGVKYPLHNLWVQSALLSIDGLIALQQGRLNDAKMRAKFVRERLDAAGGIAGDASYFEMLFYRVEAINSPETAHRRLSLVIDQYGERDLTGRLRMQLELCRGLRTLSYKKARTLAKEVYETATRIGARPIADRADSLLHRM